MRCLQPRAFGLDVKTAVIDGRDLRGGATKLAVAVIGVLAAHAAVAQDTPPKSGSSGQAGLEEIIVTAQRRMESVQETPITLSVMTADDLARNNTRELTDLSGRIPGLVVGGKLTGGGNQAITLRGVTGQTVLTGADTAVSIYLDGVYLSKPDAAFFSLADVERIEVLRGPQGTLYGRNATAGAINIITRTPSDKEWQGTLDGNYGNVGTYEAKGYVGGPIAGGLSASVSLAASGNDGYITNSLDGERINGIDTLTGRAKLRYANDDGSFDAVLTYDHNKEETDIGFFQYGYGPVSAPIYVGVSNPDETFLDWHKYNNGETVSQGASLTMNYRPFEKWTFTSVTGWREMSVDSLYSVTPPGGFPALLPTPPAGIPKMIQSINHSDYGPAVSQELRAVFEGDSLKLTTGVTYFQEDVESQFGGAIRPLDSPPADLNTVAGAPIVKTEVESYGLFAQADWEFVDKWTATLGLRGNREHREMHEVFPAVAGQPRLDSTVEDDALIPKFGVSYQPTASMMLYASYSEGYQAPGQSYSSIPPAAGGIILEVKPENLAAYEGGIKSQWLDDTLRVNATAFYYDYDPLQVRVTTGLNQFKIVNATAKVSGYELEVAAVVAEGLTLSGNLIGLDAHYDQFCDSAIPPFDEPTNCQLPGTSVTNGVSRKGNPLNQAPDLQYNLGVNYQYPFDNGMTLQLDGSYSYQSEFWSGPSQINPYLRSESLGRFNVRAGLGFDSGLEIYAYGRNLNNDQSQGTVLFTPLAGNLLDAGMITPPRTYGVGLRYSF